MCNLKDLTPGSWCAIVLVMPIVLFGCSAETQDTRGNAATPKVDAGPADYSGAFRVALWGFLDGAVMGTGRPTDKPQNVYIDGQIYDGPYPERLTETPLPLPADATPGCAVYRSTPPSCDGIGGCGFDSQNADCAAAAFTKPCVCSAQDTCEAYPTAINAGELVVTGVKDTLGNPSVVLANVSNTYRVPDSVQLQYPGFAEGDLLTLSASGHDSPAFSIAAPGVAPLLMASDTYTLVRDHSTSDPGKFQGLDIQWTPPAVTGNTKIVVEIDLSRHAGTIGYLGCEVEDSGTLTISPGLVSQIIGLGSVGGFAELTIERVAASSLPLGTGGGQVDFEVTSENEYVINVEGYTSCMQDSDCPSGQVCNRSIKLCEST